MSSEPPTAPTNPDHNPPANPNYPIQQQSYQQQQPYYHQYQPNYQHQQESYQQQPPPYQHQQGPYQQHQGPYDQQPPPYQPPPYQHEQGPYKQQAPPYHHQLYSYPEVFQTSPQPHHQHPLAPTTVNVIIQQQTIPTVDKEVNPTITENRRVILCKDVRRKLGLKVKAINKGVFVCLVKKESPAALGGLRFGDQILQINGENVTGFSTEKVHNILKKTGIGNIAMAVRDRPFSKTLTLNKDSCGNLGFQLKDGRITYIAMDSSAARNGLLVEHNLIEVNGEDVVGVKDKKIGKVIDKGGNVVTVTTIPTSVFNHFVKK